MKSYKDLSVNLKIPIMMGASALLVLALICVFLMQPLRSFSLKDSSEIAKLTASQSSERLSEKINGNVSILRAYSGVIANLAETKSIPADKKRELLLSDIKALIDSEKELTNVWCILEPNALDGLDDAFINQMGSNDSGIFDPWIANGMVSNVDHMLTSDLYIIPKTMGRETISKPYDDEFLGKKIKVFSLSIPIMLNGNFIGIIATDFDCSELYNTVASISGKYDGKLLTDEGIIAIHRDFDRIGTSIEYSNQDFIPKLSEGNIFEGMYTENEETNYCVFIPLNVGKVSKPWFYSIEMKPDAIYKNAKKTSNYLVIYCFIGVILIVIAGFLLMRPIIKGISEINKIIGKLTLGVINLNVNKSKSNDEIGLMKNELGEMVEGLKSKATFAQNIGKGNINADYSLLSSEDLLGSSLLEMRESLKKANEEQSIQAKAEEQRNWATSGLAKFAEILRRDNSDMEALAYNIISNLVDYLGANQGGLFVLNDSEDETEKYLELKGCYAFNRKKYEEKKIHLGEGLVGTCYLEGQPIYMTNIPDDYIRITSGLGDANPSALLICPLKVNDQIFGVVEIASFNQLEQYQIEFVYKVSESIASTISTVNVNIRTSKLLEQTKLQAEEMANAEEELRQNMEEMQATQEDMRRRETELHETVERMNEMQSQSEDSKYEMEQFNNAIFATNNVAEFSPDAVITDVNDNMLKLLGGSKSDFMGKHMSVFIGEKATNDAFQSIRKGSKIYEDQQTVTMPDGRSMIVKQKIMPIFDKHGKLLKVLLLAFHDQEAELLNNVEHLKSQEEELRQNMEEMSAQEEELRQTMEEIKATQEEMANKDFEMEQFYHGIFETCNVAEFTPDAIVTDVNQNMLNIFGLPKEAFIGKHMSDFVGKKAFNEAAKDVLKGKIHEDIQNVTAADGKVYKVKQKILPILNKDGKLLRVLLLAFPE